MGTWVIRLNKEARKYNIEYSKYHDSKFSNDINNLLESANVELLIQH